MFAGSMIAAFSASNARSFFLFRTDFALFVAKDYNMLVGECRLIQRSRNRRASISVGASVLQGIGRAAFEFLVG